jgi:hypothetical protein
MGSCIVIPKRDRHASNGTLVAGSWSLNVTAFLTNFIATLPKDQTTATGTHMAESFMRRIPSQTRSLRREVKNAEGCPSDLTHGHRLN